MMASQSLLKPSSISRGIKANIELNDPDNRNNAKRALKETEEFTETRYMKEKAKKIKKNLRTEELLGNSTFSVLRKNLLDTITNIDELTKIRMFNKFPAASFSKNKNIKKHVKKKSSVSLAQVAEKTHINFSFGDKGDKNPGKKVSLKGHIPKNYSVNSNNSG